MLLLHGKRFATMKELINFFENVVICSKEPADDGYDYDRYY